MNEAVWYYARGDTEKGPITTLQIKALAGAGKLRRDDFVWKEGMETWLPAGEVADLFPAGRDQAEGGRPADSSGRGDSQKFPRSLSQPRPRPGSESVEFVLLAGRVLFGLGLLVALTSRGCDRLGSHNAERLSDLAEAARHRFDFEQEQRRAEIQGELDALRNKESRTNTENERMRRLGESATSLAEETLRKRRELEQTEWRDHDEAARTAAEKQLRWSYWRKVIFLLATFAMTLGLLGLGFAGEGPERWGGFAMMAVVVFSLFSGAGVWETMGP